MSLVKTADLHAHLFGYGKPRSIVTGSVYPLTGTEFFDVALHLIGVDAERAVRIHRTHVVINNHVLPSM